MDMTQYLVGATKALEALAPRGNKRYYMSTWIIAK